MIEDIFDLPRATPATLAKLPAERLAELHAAAASHMSEASKIIAVLHDELTRRYADGLNSTGTHHRTDGAVAITVTVPKRVKWDQAGLAAALETLKGWGEDPAHYVDTEIKVREARYDAWPPAIRDLFTPARTVEHGKAVFKLAAVEAEAA
jgi:hypothetical protein